MKLLLRNGTEICILIPPQWREVIENELFGGIKSAGFVVDLTELPPARLSPEESALLDKIINDALWGILRMGHSFHRDNMNAVHTKNRAQTAELAILHGSND